MISTTSKYGIKSVCYLAQQPETRFVAIREISDELDIPFQYLTKLLQRLQQGGIIDSRRGNTGGVSLARPASEITLSDILHVLEPGFQKHSCLLHAEDCRQAGYCPFGKYWAEIEDRIHDLLISTNVEWITQNGTQLPESSQSQSFGQGSRVKF